MALNIAQVLGQRSPDSGSYTPQDVARRRLLAERLRGNTVTDAGALGAIGNTLSGALAGYEDTQASRIESEGQSAARERLLAALNDPGGGVTGLAAVASDPFLNESGSRIASALLGQRIQQQDPAYQLDLAYKQAQLDALNNPAPRDPTSAIQNYEYLIGQGVDPAQAQEMSFGGGGTTINNLPTVGTPPAGYQNIYDDAGRLLRQERIEGGPAADEAAALAAAEAANAAQTERYGNVVTEDIDRALTLIEKDPAFTTGILGQTLSQIGGTPANRVKNLIETVKSNVGFDRLQAMRESSPTGGALGSVTERELSLLTSAIGSLEQSNNDQDLAYNLRRVNKIYMDIIHGPGNWEPKQSGDEGWQDLGGGIRIRPIGQ